MNKVYKVFPGGKFKVLTFSYDDGKIEDRRLVKLFNKFNLKATFNLNTGIIDPAIEFLRRNGLSFIKDMILLSIHLHILQ